MASEKNNEIERNASNKIVYDFQDERIKEFPRMVIAGLSFACNAKCIHCIYDSFPETKKETAGVESLFMDEDVFKRIADECSRFPWALLRLVGFGEPMLHPKFDKLIKYAKEVGCNVGIITNGSLLNEERAKALLDAEVDAIDISVDAFSKEVYERIRVGLDFDKLLENVKMLVDLRNKMKKKTFVFCSIVEQEESMPELEEALDFWNKIADKAVSRKFLTFGLFKNDERRIPYYERRIPCFLLYDRINIDVGGIIRLCGYDSFGKTNFGDIRNTLIQDAWKSEKLKGIRKLHQSARFEEVEICKDCVDWPFHSWQKNYMVDSYGK
jgi:MoaA/NifB/PqqE/SkfB family radical SAM enzyme